MMKRNLAFVLGGGGARGAMQVGALRALFEAGLKPDLLVGTSIGAANSAMLALWGMDMAGIEKLELAYRHMADARLMDPRLAKFAWNTVSGRPNLRGSQYAREFLISEGITPEIQFGQIQGVRLATVTTNLNTRQPFIYGLDTEQAVLEGVLASTALPPWFAPIEKDGHCLIDGGAVSNLPIEAALTLGATEIVALDLSDPGRLPEGNYSSNANNNAYVKHLISAVAQREIALEIQLAAARKVPVKYVRLTSSPYVQTWDFSTHRDLFKIGYQIMKNEMSSWPQERRSSIGFLQHFTKKFSSALTSATSRGVSPLPLE
jgi:NTE family protein